MSFALLYFLVRFLLDALLARRQAETQVCDLLDERALAIRKNVLGPDHPHIAASHRALESLSSGE